MVDVAQGNSFLESLGKLEKQRSDLQLKLEKVDEGYEKEKILYHLSTVNSKIKKKMNEGPY